MKDDLNSLLESKDKEIQRIRNESESKILELEEKNNQMTRQVKQKSKIINVLTICTLLILGKLIFNLLKLDLNETNEGIMNEL